MIRAELWSEIFGGVQALGVVATLIALVRSNRRLTASLRMSTLQQMVAEMNRIRTYRADDPALERALFPERAEWTDARVRAHLVAVQLANVFEWAYLARRDGLLDRDVWESWVQTWRGVILTSEPLRQSFSDTVWTFGRSPEVVKDLRRMIQSNEHIGDPRSCKISVMDRMLGHE